MVYYYLNFIFETSFGYYTILIFSEFSFHLPFCPLLFFPFIGPSYLYQSITWASIWGFVIEFIAPGCYYSVGFDFTSITMKITWPLNVIVTLSCSLPRSGIINWEVVMRVHWSICSSRLTKLNLKRLNLLINTMNRVN